MKTTDFFKQVKKVAKDSTLEIMFNFSIDHDKHFFEIMLHSEPSEKVKAMCEKYGFSIKQNTSYPYRTYVATGEWVPKTIWEVRPVNTEDIVWTSYDILCNINENVIVASDKTMVEAGLVECNPREDRLILWVYMLNSVWKVWQWTPIMQVFTKPLKEAIKDDKGNIEEPKSTHKIHDFYGAPVFGNIDLRELLTSYNVDIKEL